MEEEALPDDLVMDHTAARHKRSRTSDSGSSTSAESIHSTRTLNSEDFEFVQENGREYGNHTYFMPCDQLEQDRLTIQHQVFVHALKGKLTTTPISPLQCRILDLGTGPGNWAVAMARQFPYAEVVGLDMAVWDLETTEENGGSPQNVSWEIDDLDVWGEDPHLSELTFNMEHFDPYRDPITPRDTLESPSKSRQPRTPGEGDCSFDPLVLDPGPQVGWHFSEPFDLIHMRGMKGAFVHWEEVYAEIYKSLSPGGWVEVADFELMLPEMPNSQLPPGDAAGNLSQTQPDNLPLPTIRKLYFAGMQAAWKGGRHLGTSYMHATYLEDAGFKDIRTTYVNVPVGTWPEDREQKKIGKMFLVVLLESIETHLLRLLTQFGDADRLWSAEEVREQVEQGKREIFDWSEGVGSADRKEGWCASFKWIIGRKSKNAE
ncbi:S-adenosyl-L-methionine-dependent methyltransferase [Aaosphaeria arxii CBS 175.79]|uniref:S-adenosyl-L-methionine-dependent methyltransferase n=1 Tax=Aaosphaeria arxii CBS 175.79 TaxID=1450172 RepID=A0A6A5XHD5_9PLEO|nr:S-adenosyl-L-methionine-dependent methyltransferase [Aaosphaeria arxii CBS 175.79]KAF2012628.1 S-adenosyl-L-methionine-dependent methyltransferase [Aaosphaeria arxii CBS 175.79]